MSGETHFASGWELRVRIPDDYWDDVYRLSRAAGMDQKEWAWEQLQRVVDRKRKTRAAPSQAVA
jgi:hypothetical protein